MKRFSDADRTYTNESDGKKFYGYDDDNGHTTWYDEEGNCDCSTPCGIGSRNDEGDEKRQRKTRRR